MSRAAIKPAPVMTTKRTATTMFLSRVFGWALIASLGIFVFTSAGVTAPAGADVPSRPAFGVDAFSARALDASGNDYTVAGGHPYEATTSFSFPTYTAPGRGVVPVEDVKDIFVELPPGFVGSAGAAPRCPLAKLQSLVPLCPVASKIGELTLSTFGNALSRFGFYNMVPERGFPAEFAFKISSNSVVSYPRVRSRNGQYGIVVAVPGVSRLAVTGINLTLYGVPSQRNGTGGPPIPFLSNQSDCLIAQPTTRIVVDSWQAPARKLDDGLPDMADAGWKTAIAPAPPVTGCDDPLLASQFVPTLKARPTPGTGSTAADTPSGYKVDLTFPQSNDPTDPTTVFDPSIPAAPQPKDATVTLPAGVAISPAAADGLDGCSDVPGDDQVRLDSTVPVSCPDASKIGSVVATSPLLPSHDPDTDAVTGAEPIDGDVYLVKPHEGDLSAAGDQGGRFRILIQLENEDLGINAKLPGIVTADKATGLLTARFVNNPELPVKTLSVTFKGGARAPLVNPPTCTSATTTGVFSSWAQGGTRSDGLAVLGTPAMTATSSFAVDQGANGAPCASSAADLPFSPGFSAGVTDTQAGGSSSFVFRLTRQDGEQDLGSIDTTLPPGLLGNIGAVPLCPEDQAAAGTCDSASQIGTTTVGAGAGPSPLFIPQPGKDPTAVYLAGPYKGAPYSLSIMVPAQAGPFDLGNVVVRAALFVDQNDAHVTVKSDPLPTIRDGVPLRVRDVRVNIDRPGFMRLPTSCAPETITSDVHSLGGKTASLSVPFQVDGCDQLPFAPKLSMKLTGASQMKVGGHPGVEALVTQQAGEAGVKALTVTLPLSLALDPNNAASDDLCEFADGLKDQCPEKSVIGTMTAVSPLLKAPLSGKVYFVKGVRTDPKSGRLIRTLPTLLIELRGEISVNLRATSEVPDGKHLTSTFPMIPDAPLSSAFLKLNGGPKGVLVVTDGHNDICYTPQKPFLAAVAQNGKRLDTATTLTPECSLAVVSRTFTPSSVGVRVSGIGAGTVTVSGPGLKTTRRTITSAASATITATLTAKGKRMRRAKQDIRVKVSFTSKGTKKAKTAYSPKAKK